MNRAIADEANPSIKRIYCWLETDRYKVWWDWRNDGLLEIYLGTFSDWEATEAAFTDWDDEGRPS